MLDYLGTFKAGHSGTFECYRNHDGFIEGYRSQGTQYLHGTDHKIGGDIKRIVSCETTPEAFIEYVKGLRSKPPDPEQITKLQQTQPKLF